MTADNNQNKVNTDSGASESCAAQCCASSPVIDKRQRRINIIALIVVGMAVLFGILLPLLSAKQVNYTTYDKNLPSLIAVGKLSCPACSEQKHTFEHLAESFDGKVNIIYYDKGSDFAKKIAAEHTINVFPTLFLIDSTGNVVKVIHGGMGESGLKSAVEGLGWV